MSPSNYIKQTRKIGRKAIMPIFKALYDIDSWPGCKGYAERNNLPLRKTDSGKPMIILEELIEFERTHGRVELEKLKRKPKVLDPNLPLIVY